MDNGWIKLHRKFLEWEWYDKPEMVQLFIFLLLSANHADNQWRGKTIKRGQLVTSYANIKAKTGLSIQTIRTCIRRLKSTSEITSQSTSHFTLITVCGYDDYQQSERATNTPNNTAPNKPSTSHQQATNKPLTTNKNEKNEKNDKKNTEDDKSSMSNGEHSTQINYEEVVSFFNSKTKGVFGEVRYPIGETRKSSVRARIREHGKEAFEEMIITAAGSDFLKGENQRGFKATFDWLIKPNNFQKTLEGNYNNNTKSHGKDKRADANAIRKEEFRQYAARAGMDITQER